MLNKYKEEINEMVNNSNDFELLDLIFKLLANEDK